MPQDLYVVLGVSKDADLATIRRAYRRLAKSYHPDAGGSPAERFLELRRAYETLADHAERARQEAGATPQVEVPVTVAQATAPAVRAAPGGGLIADVTPSLTFNRARPDGFSTPRPAADMHTLFAALDEFFGGLVPGIYTRGHMAARRKDLHVELVLDRDEAIAGGCFPLDIPVRALCERCHGMGYEGLAACPECKDGSVSHHRITISVPKNVAGGSQTRLSLYDLGLPEVDLVISVSVRP
ncbi:MAG: DnaJ domain-containing protein [Deltaproteobacteria bacterium]|nr:DnaJ domain-containing protein [Deltaproteobacteria bacterium]